MTAHPGQMTRSLPTGTTHPLAELTVPLSNIHTDIYLRLAQFAVFSIFHVSILSVPNFPGNGTHDLGFASTMLYHLGYRKAQVRIPFW